MHRFDFIDEECTPQEDQPHVFHHGDFSGDVTFVLDGTRKQRVHVDESTGNFEVNLPMTWLKELVAAYVRHRRIGDLESMSPDEVLGLFEREEITLVEHGGNGKHS